MKPHWLLATHTLHSYNHKGLGVASMGLKHTGYKLATAVYKTYWLHFFSSY